MAMLNNQRVSNWYFGVNFTEYVDRLFFFDLNPQNRLELEVQQLN